MEKLVAETLKEIVMVLYRNFKRDKVVFSLILQHLKCVLGCREDVYFLLHNVVEELEAETLKEIIIVLCIKFQRKKIVFSLIL